MSSSINSFVVDVGRRRKSPALDVRPARGGEEARGGETRKAATAAAELRVGAVPLSARRAASHSPGCGQRDQWMSMNDAEPRAAGCGWSEKRRECIWLKVELGGFLGEAGTRPALVVVALARFVRPRRENRSAG
jgi:hypothetical protein